MLCAEESSKGESKDLKISNKFFETLIKHIIAKTEEPSLKEQIGVAFKVAWTNQEGEDVDNISVEENSNAAEEIPTQEVQSTDVIAKYKDLISEYNGKKGVSIKAFCSERKIDEEEFKYAQRELIKQSK